MKILYISYDGALDQLGYSQIIPYLVNLSQRGIEFTLLTFEKKESFRNIDKVIKLKQTLEEKNIKWEILLYHKSPTVPATILDIVSGTLKTLIIIFRDKIQLIQARSFVGAVPALLLVKLFRLKFIYDMRGFWPDERVDGGIWKRDCLLYKIAKFFEKRFMLYSDRIVVLTQKAKEIMQTYYLKAIKAPIEVIPTCVDLSLFSVREKDIDIVIKIDKANRFIFTYFGSIGTWYCLEEMADFFKVAKQKIGNAYFIFLTVAEAKAIQDAMFSKGFSRDDFMIKSLQHHEVPRWLSIADITIFFIKPLFSKTSSCPTKFAESLACGLPVIANSGIGDTADIIKRERVGVVVESFNEDSYRKAIGELLSLLEEGPQLRERCRATAIKYFSLQDGVNRYFQIYREILTKNSEGR